MKVNLHSFLFLILLISGCAPSSQTSSQSANPVLMNRQLIKAEDSRISYCEILENHQSTYSGYRDSELLPLASTSKLITTAWALDQLGPQFQFQLEFFLNPIDLKYGFYDVYLKTNYDPVMNIEKLLFILSELRQAGVQHIRQLVVDESTRVFLSVLANPHLELDQVPTSKAESLNNLKIIFNSKNWAEKTKQARINLLNWAQTENKKLNLPESFITDEVKLFAPNQLNPAKYKYRQVIQSAPLVKYLKNLNVYSNNYLADALFSFLGGEVAFQSFQKNKLKLSSDELILFTGSGLPMIQNEFRQDNLGSCFAMIKVLKFIRQLAEKNQLNLGSILLNPTSDQEGTFNSNSQYNNAIVLKTGRLFEVPALNAVGFVATTQGLLSFVFLGHDFKSQEAAEIEMSRFEMIQNIFQNYQTQPQFITTEYQDIFL